MGAPPPRPPRPRLRPQPLVRRVARRRATREDAVAGPHAPAAWGARRPSAGWVRPGSGAALGVLQGAKINPEKDQVSRPK